MKAEKIPETASNWTLRVLGGLSLLLIVLFWWGYGEEEFINGKAQVTSTFDDALIIFMYILGAIGVVAAIASAVMSGLNGGSAHNEDKKISLVGNVLGWGGLIVSLVIGWVAGIGSEAFTAMDGTVTEAGMVQMSVMFIFSIYILSLIAIVGTIASMAGLFKR